MQFPFRDLTNQYISLSYQDVVQRYAQGTASYFLDGLGNVLGFIPVGSLGQQILTADQPSPPSVSASYALSASYAVNGGESGVSASYALNASNAILSETSSISLFATFCDTASVSFESTFSDTSSLASFSNYADSASYAFTASYIDPSVIPPVNVPFEFGFSTDTSATNPGLGKFKFDNAVPLAVSSIYINDTTDDGLDITRILSRFQSGSLDLYIQDKGEAAVSMLYTVAGTPIDSGGWFVIPVICQASSNGVPANNEVCIFSLLSTSDPTASVALTASNLSGWNFTNTSSDINVFGNDIPVAEISTGSYNSAFFDYVAISESNCRAGIVFGSWVNGLINYTEVGNVDVGDTSKVTMSLALNGGNVQLLANVTDTIPWQIKALGRYL